ncbi:MAG: RNA methyltransferase [Rhodospirillales bacterium]|nr:RNA methyltransferase [Rhodospirillales bacterium]
MTGKRKAARPRETPRGQSRDQSRDRTRRPSLRQPQASGLWLFGHHAVFQALRNQRRQVRRLLASAPAGDALAALLSETGRPAPELVAREEIDRRLPAGAVHQGLALACNPLPQPDLEHFLRELTAPRATVVVLDGITDPQNVGAILRSAAAFGAAAVLTTTGRAPEESGTLAKAASGALEIVPYIRETNLARALDRMQAAGFWCLGLDEAGQPLQRAPAPERTVLAMGAEGAGLRRLTKARCDLLLRLPTRPPIGTLNVSNAAAVALYQLTGGGEAA